MCFAYHLCNCLVMDSASPMRIEVDNLPSLKALARDIQMLLNLEKPLRFSRFDINREGVK